MGKIEFLNTCLTKQDFIAELKEKRKICTKAAQKEIDRILKKIMSNKFKL